MRVPIACVTRAWWSFGRLSGSRPLAWFWAWSWDPPRFMRRHPPHHLSPARAKHPAGQDPEARLSRSRSPQQRSNQARKPVNSEQDSCSFPSIVLTPNARHSEGICAANRLPEIILKVFACASIGKARNVQSATPIYIDGELVRMDIEVLG